MGIVKNIGVDKFPKQGEHLNKDVKVCFNFDTTNTVKGKCVRDDREAPGLTIFQLENGRFVLATECQYQLN